MVATVGLEVLAAMAAPVSMALLAATQAVQVAMGAMVASAALAVWPAALVAMAMAEAGAVRGMVAREVRAAMVIF